jgi:Kef-type K+ transport system membrane component KefB/nucleotide-binding universal stress UspA family protein
LAILLLVILVVPILFERLRLPGLLGLISAGVVLGLSGWHLLPSSLPIINLVSDIGLGYLIFIAGLEFDFQIFQNHKVPALIFGGLNISLSLCLGIFLGEIFGWAGNTSILIGALLAAYTPLAYPIISRLGVVNNPPVNVTIAATLVTNIVTLLILSLSLPNSHGQLINLATILPGIIIYMMVILVGVDWLGKEFFQRLGDQENYKFLFVILSVFLAIVVAQLLGIEKFLGVFLVGLAVNDVVEKGPVKEKLVFIGTVLFIPIFLIHLGAMLDFSEFYNNNNIQLLVFMFLGAIASKFIAALLTKLLYQYEWIETITMWSLSMPMVGTTLAVTLVGYRSGLLSSAIFNNIIILTLITSLFSPWLTSLLAERLTCALVNQGMNINLSSLDQHLKYRDFNILVPIYNSQTQQHLIEMAALLARQFEGKIVPLTIAKHSVGIAHATTQIHNQRLEKAFEHSEWLLTKATTQCQSLGANVEPLLRIDNAFAPAISRTAREQKASLIIMGWSNRHGLKARLFGNVIDNVLWSAHCPVVVARLVESPKRIQRILVPIENLITPSLEAVKFAQILANANQAQVTLLNVCINDMRRVPMGLQTDVSGNFSQIAIRRSHLSQWLSQLNLTNPPEAQIIIHENVTLAILQASRLYDLVIFPYIRNRISPEGLATHDVTNQLAKQLTCSMIILGEPPTNTTKFVPTGLPNPQVLNI